MARLTPSLQEKMRALRQDYIDGLSNRLSAINAAAKFLLNDWNEDNASELRRLMHSLNGSGATFGFPELSHSASILETHMEYLLQQNIVGKNLADEIQPLLVDIEKQITEIKGQPDDHVRKAAWKTSEVIELDQDTKNKLILIVDDDEASAQQLANTIEGSGYTVHIIRKLEELQQSITKLKPATIIMDLVFPESGLGGADAIQLMQKIEGYDIPVIFISLRYDYDARLAVSRTGAKYFFNKPVSTSKLIRALDELTIHKPRDQYRVMIVDDDLNIAEYHSMVLKSAGMATRIISISSEILDQIPIFLPELILMDLYMPGCSGAELAHIIRQDNAYDMMPVVFLSSETNISRQMDAIMSGGDDFLTKPISPNNLVSLVSTRIERARMLTITTQELRSALRENQTQKTALDQHAIVSIADPEGLITYANDKFCEISKYSRNELIGKNHRLLNSGFHDKAFFKDMWEHIANGKIWHGDIKNIARDGSHYWVDSTIMPFLDNNGRPYQYVSIRTDISHIKEAEEELRKKDNRLQRQQTALMALANDESLISGNLELALNTITENVAFTLNVECVVIKLFNDDNTVLRFADVYSRSTDSHSLEPDWTRTDFQTYFDALENNLAIVADEAANHPLLQELIESCYQKAGIVSSIDTVIRRHGQLLGVVTIGSNDERSWWPEDQSYALSIADMVALGIEQFEHHKALDALRTSQERLSLSQDFARIGTWDWDINSGDLYWSDKMKQLFDYPLNSDINPNFEAFITLVHEDDRGALLDSITDCLKQGSEYNIEFRILHNDKSVHWIHAHGDVTRDAQNEPLHMIGVAQDISAHKYAEEGRERRQQLLDLLHKVTSQFVDENVEEYSAMFSDMLEGILDLSESKYGFVGEVIFEDGTGYLKTHAISNIAWDEESEVFYDQNTPQGPIFRNLNTLYGAAITSKKIIISNTPAEDTRAGGLPDGHPALDAFLGVPVFYGNEMVGMYGLANHPGGYNQEIIDFLEPFNSTLGVIINGIRTNSDRLATQRALIEAKEEAEKANQAKSTFLSSMSHELRTPLNAILGFAQLFEYEEENPLNDSQQDNIQQILKSGWHLLELINEILDLSKIESGKIDLSMEGIVLNEVLDDCAGLIEPLAQKHNITLINNIPSYIRSILIYTDRTRIRQVLLNLMSNAVKYNKENGSIIIECTPQKNMRLRISVTDAGAGIPESQQALLFQPFERLGANESEIEGTGIGLVITKRLIKLMGGNIGFESTPNKGSTFWIEVDALSNTSRNEINNSTAEIDLNYLQQNKEKNITVLYVEDNPANLKLVWQILSRQAQFEMLSAHTAELGLVLAHTHQPDIIIMDLSLPGMNGYEALSRLRADEKTKHIPVLALSANAMPSDIEKGLAAGFDDYLTKPINIKKFNTAIERVVASL